LRCLGGHGGCGVLVSTEKGKVVKIAGDPGEIEEMRKGIF
jgi:anaerobic selenocysteine-containing dehydrogenase